MLSRGLEVHQWMVLATILLLIAQVIGTNTEDGYGEVSVETTEPEPHASRVSVPEFVATNEWQELLPGQSVPRGLHIRLNMETGKREAKLVDYSTAESEKAMHARVVGLNAHEANPIAISTDISGDVLAGENDDITLTAIDDEIKHDAFEEDAAGFESEKLVQDTLSPAEPNWNHEKIYDVLQALPEPPKIDGIDIHEAHEKLTPAEFREQIVTLWKKRQAELKEALESLQDDAKYLGKLLQQLEEAEHEGDVEGQLSVLEVLEWEVQDLDKTHVFNFIGGFGILAEYLNSTSLPVRARAAWVIGSAAKNYNDGQEWAIDAGVVPLLMESLKLETPNTEEAAKSVFEVKKKSIYALSSIVRSNARGQRLFLRYDGPHLLAGILNDTYPTKLQMKVLLFMYDLLAEASYMELRESDFPELFELKKIFQSSEWCGRVSTTFIKMAPQLDRQEVGQLVDAMRHQLPACQLNHQASGVKSVVESLAKRV